MTLSGASSATVITDANGDYTFIGLDNGSYTITPSRTGFIFSPTSSPQTVRGADITAVNFTGTRVQPVTYSISGNVVSGNPAPFPGVIGVTMTLSGATSATTITGGSGSYAFTGLDNGSYTITPTSTVFLKDIRLMLDAGQELHVPLPLTGMMQQLYTAACAGGQAKEDLSGIVRLYEATAGLGCRDADEAAGSNERGRSHG